MGPKFVSEKRRETSEPPLTKEAQRGRLWCLCRSSKSLLKSSGFQGHRPQWIFENQCFLQNRIFSRKRKINFGFSNGFETRLQSCMNFRLYTHGMTARNRRGLRRFDWTKSAARLPRFECLQIFSNHFNLPFGLFLLGPLTTLQRSGISERYTLS